MHLLVPAISALFTAINSSLEQTHLGFGVSLHKSLTVHFPIEIGMRDVKRVEVEVLECGKGKDDSDGGKAHYGGKDL